jgi:hypothetical protein
MVTLPRAAAVALSLALLVVAALAAAAAPAQAKTVWLCKPGMRGDACKVPLTTTRVTPAGKKLSVERVKADRTPDYDCFYVYPTVSDQPRIQATRKVDAVLRSIALYQAARYSRGCRVFAPVYRQITLRGLLNPGEITERMRDEGYADVRAAWREYLQRHNKGRGVVLIGHSQGTFVLKRLVAEEIDPSAKERRRIISALLLGGNVEVASGRDTGGTFKNVPACRRAAQIGCVVAFSVFGETPPDEPRFGRSVTAGRRVLCTNPGSLGGGATLLNTIYPTKPFAQGTIALAISIVGSEIPKASTPWVEVVGGYRGSCSSANGSDVLRITPVGGAPRLNASPDAGWGLHLVDANVALGELEALVKTQAAAYARRR